MIKRNVKFTVADGMVVPSVPQYGGVKGETCATLLGITLEKGVYEDGDVVRLSFTTGDGTVLSSELLDNVTVTDGTLYAEYALPQIVTVAAGQLCVRLVVSRMDGEHEVQTYRSPEMVLWFEEAGLENGTPFWTGVSQMLARTVSAQERSVDAASKAINARDAAYTSAQTASQKAIAAATSALTAQAAAQQAREAIDSMESIHQAYTLTDMDKAAIVTEVLTVLGGAPVFGYVNDDNIIVVSGNLANGDYIVKYEMEDGTILDIGALTLAADEPDVPVEPDEPDQPTDPDVPDTDPDVSDTPTGTYTNLADPNSDEWMDGYRLEFDGVIKENDGTTLVNTISCASTDVVRIKGMTGVIAGLYKKGAWYARKTVNDANFRGAVVDGDYTQFSTAYSDVTEIRVYGALSGTAEDVIITVNEPIV